MGRSLRRSDRCRAGSPPGPAPDRCPGRSGTARSVCAVPVRGSRSRPARVLRRYLEAGPVLLRIFGPGFFPLRVRGVVAPGHLQGRPPVPGVGGMLRPRRGARHARGREDFGPFPAEIIPPAAVEIQGRRACFCWVCSKVILCFKSKFREGHYLVISLKAQALGVPSCTCSN